MMTPYDLALLKHPAAKYIPPKSYIEVARGKQLPQPGIFSRLYAFLGREFNQATE